MPRAPLTEREREEVRQRILAAAQILFDNQGLEAVSMRAIGGRVGLAASALYAYFPSKQDLVRALWQSALNDLEQRFQQLSSRESDPLQAIIRLGQAYADFAVQNPVRYRLLFMAPPSPAQIDAETHFLARGQEIYGHLRARVAEAIDRGWLRPSDPDLAAQTLWAGLFGVLGLHATCTVFPICERQAMLDTMMRTLLRGMTTDAAPRDDIPGEQS